LSLIRRVQARGVPIDAIGSQTHLTSGHVSELPAQLRRLASTGLDVAITEPCKRTSLSSLPRRVWSSQAVLIYRCQVSRIRTRGSLSCFLSSAPLCSGIRILPKRKRIRPWMGYSVWWKVDLRWAANISAQG
ncbi:hypothetical protein DFP72DRAFT_818070, partial [Ephemerocybe angulata]